MYIDTFLNEWLATINSYNTESYLEKYLDNAEFDDPSVGRKFIGKDEIREYFTSYFIEYKTHARLVKLDITGNKAYMEVEFTGEFPEKQIGGTFDFTFKYGKIEKVTADLIKP